MKILYTLIILLIFNPSVYSQQGFNLTFEDTTVINQVFYTDNVLDPSGIWQIGTSSKPFFMPSYSPPNGVMTLLDSSLPANTNASFIITIPGRGYSPLGSLLTFAHKYDFDSAHSGGYVEFSYDSGATWASVGTSGISDGGLCIFGDSQVYVNNNRFILPVWWGTIPAHTTAQGIPYFTGTDSTWIQDTIVIPQTAISNKTNQLTSLMFRFTVFADSFARPRSGWIIDNINFASDLLLCPGGINELNSSHLRIYPDPATDGFTLTVSGEPGSSYDYALYDLSGRPMLQSSFTGQEVLVRRGDIASGTYFIQVTDSRTHATYQKRMVFE